jgi:hypothetical protein
MLDASALAFYSHLQQLGAIERNVQFELEHTATSIYIQLLMVKSLRDIRFVNAVKLLSGSQEHLKQPCHALVHAAT